MTKTNQEIIDNIKTNGPTRVVTSDEGQTTTPDIALDNFAIVPDVVFIRNDGWSLGANMKHYDVAFKMWEGDWVAALHVATGIVTAIKG